MATSTAPKKTTKVVINEIAVGDVFSEVSHYTFIEKDAKGELKLLHHESNQTVTLDPSYVEVLLCSANQYHKTVTVGKEDKLWNDKRIQEWIAAQKIGYDPKDMPKLGDIHTPGIRTIWENIHSAQVFAVTFQKQDESLTKKELEALRDTQIKNALEAISKAQKGKTGVAAAAEAELRKVQENPITGTKPGEMRTLIGYKLQFTSRDGRYQCMDMQKKAPRPVNINTIEAIVFDGVKYILE